MFFDRALLAARALPGVEHAALSDSFPVGDYATPFTADFRTEKEVVGADGQVRNLAGMKRAVRGGYAGVSPGFLATLGLPLRRGRDITVVDQDSTPLVVS